MTIVFHPLPRVAKFGPLSPFVVCWLGFQTAADVMITTVLIYALKNARTGFHKTDTIINRLIRGAVQTGLFASIFALCDLFSFLLRRQTYLYAMFAYPIGRIYTNVRHTFRNINVLDTNDCFDLDFVGHLECS